MGTFSVQARIQNPVHAQRFMEVERLVDSGAAYMQLPTSFLTSLEIQPFEQRPVVFAEGREEMRSVGLVVLHAEGRRAGTQVFFGEEQGLNLLRAPALQELGLGVAPIRHRLIPLRLPMAGTG